MMQGAWCAALMMAALLSMSMVAVELPVMM
jgi:hypothetical protein